MKLLFGLLLLMPTAVAAQSFPECQEFAPARPSADVAYKEGIDVRGRPVVPADINPPMLTSEQGVVVPISVEFANQLGYVDPNIGMEGVIGFVEVMPDGAVTYNGQDLSGRVEAICGDGAGAAANGQTDSDTIESAPVPPPGKPAQDSR